MNPTNELVPYAILAFEFLCILNLSTLLALPALHDQCRNTKHKQLTGERKSCSVISLTMSYPVFRLFPLAVESNRVKLRVTGAPCDEGFDYINASFINVRGD